MTLYSSVKRYGHERGFSCAFRQWRAESHCQLLHGYAFAFEFQFSSETLDENNWVVDFGALKPLEEWLREMFDHTTIVAEDDPQYGLYCDMQEQGIVNLRFVESTGCEKFAEMAYIAASRIAKQISYDRVRLDYVKVSEHGSNSAIYWGEV